MRALMEDEFLGEERDFPFGDLEERGRALRIASAVWIEGKPGEHAWAFHPPDGGEESTLHVRSIAPKCFFDWGERISNTRPTSIPKPRSP
jgi:hypothetical protein